MRTLVLPALLLAPLAVLPVAALPAADPPAKPALAPTAVTLTKPEAVLGEVADTLSKQSGVPVAVPTNLLKAKCAADFNKTPFWEALERAADRTGTRIVLSNGGRKVELVPRGKSVETAATSGAFRVVAQRTTGTALFDDGATFHDVHLLVHWEPRVRVYRIDTVPKITKVTDARGSKVTATGGGARVLPLDATAEMKVTLSGLTGRSEKITSLSGAFTATAADGLLAFAFQAPGGKLPAEQKQSDVTAKLKRVQKKGDTWEVVVEVNYPEGQPVFESFQGEWWLRDNRLLLRDPNGKTVVLTDYEIPQPDNPRPLVVTYRFKEDAAKGIGNPTAAGWSLVYETPAPLAEVTVPFEMKNIPLP